MRIWTQSNTALRTDPKWADYTRAIEAHLNELKRPGSEVRVEGVAKMEKNVIGSAYDRYLNARQVVELGIQAEKEGYDAFVVLGLGVAGYEELRAQLKIPVVYAESAAWNFAVWRYRRFALIGHEPEVYLRRVEQIRVHGSQALFVPGDYCDFTEQQVLDAFKDPAPMMKALEASTAQAVRQGAKVLIPDFNVLNDLIVSAGVRSFHGVPVMDTAGVALKAAEMLVDARRAGVPLA
jgi:Asp/Glu/hydantoin racemase